MIKKIKERIIVLICISFLINCKSKNENNETIDYESKKRIELNQRIIERTERDLKKFGIKKILLTDKGRWDFYFISEIEFKEDGKGYTFLHGKKDERFFYWKVENNKLYINPNNAIKPLNENKYLLTIIKSIPMDLLSDLEFKNLKNCKYSFIIESEDKRLELRLTSYFPKKVIE